MSDNAADQLVEPACLKGGEPASSVAPQVGRAPGRDCLLGVESSLCGKRWEARSNDERLTLALSQQFALPDLAARVMVGRGIGLEAAEAYLSPSLKRDLPDPFLLKDMEAATERLAQAVLGGERIAIFADYDVDGATSAAVMARFLASLGVTVSLYVPDRLREGYGPNAPALEKLKAGGAELVLCLDCGTTALDALAAGAAAGLDIIVLDHHTAEPRLPSAQAVVNPNRLDDTSGLGHLAAVGVTFLAVVALNRRLREGGFYGAGRPEPDLMSLLDLVALGTVCDVVPLAGLNRALVARGLAVLARRGNPGLAALLDLGRVDERPGAFHLGFVLGPRINAGGRVGVSDAGARLLLGAVPGETQDLARQLDRWNEDRQALEAQALEEALEQVEAGQGVSQGLVFAAGQGWHPGVVGIVASRLQDRYQRPTLVIALDETGQGKGSGRSVPGVDLGAAIIAARQSELLTSGGGHPMAAGVTVPPGGLEAFRQYITARLDHDFARSGFRPSLGLDGVLHPAGARMELLETLEKLGPYGQGNPEPRFAIARGQVVAAEIVGQRHVRCFVAGSDGSRLKAIAFRSVETPLGQALLNTRGLPLHLAGKLRIDRWSGQARVQFIIEDAAPCA